MRNPRDNILSVDFKSESAAIKIWRCCAKEATSIPATERGRSSVFFGGRGNLSYGAVRRRGNRINEGNSEESVSAPMYLSTSRCVCICALSSRGQLDFSGGLVPVKFRIEWIPYICIVFFLAISPLAVSLQLVRWFVRSLSRSLASCSSVCFRELFERAPTCGWLCPTKRQDL